MKISEGAARAMIAVFLIVGTLGMFLVLAFVTIPDGNREMVLSLMGAWTLGVGLMLKRMFEGSDSSDKKNDIIASQAATLAAQGQAPPAADPPAGAPGAS